MQAGRHVLNCWRDILVLVCYKANLPGVEENAPLQSHQTCLPSVNVKCWKPKGPSILCADRLICRTRTQRIPGQNASAEGWLGGLDLFVANKLWFGWWGCFYQIKFTGPSIDVSFSLLAPGILLRRRCLVRLLEHSIPFPGRQVCSISEPECPLYNTNPVCLHLKL